MISEEQELGPAQHVDTAEAQEFPTADPDPWEGGNIENGDRSRRNRTQTKPVNPRPVTTMPVNPRPANPRPATPAMRAPRPKTPARKTPRPAKPGRKGRMPATPGKRPRQRN